MQVTEIIDPQLDLVAYLPLLKNNIRKKYPPISKITSKKLIHMGDKTHHQDHEICSISFKTINMIVNSPTNPIPPLDELDEFDIISLPLLIFKKLFQVTSLSQSLYQ